MIKNICPKEDCTGCMACLNACPYGAITIKRDEEGFDRPVLLEKKCKDCGICRKVCPINHHPSISQPLLIFSGWSKDENIRLNSSSGGAFVELSRIILSRGGIVFGCALDEELKAVHISVDNMDDLVKKISGSKYVQSKIGNSYKLAKEYLLQGKDVLFSGTACQIAALRNYLHKEYSNLITVDLICHGVPSPMIFEDYKKYMEKKLNIKIEDIKFRCKKYSWIFFNMSIYGHVEKNGTQKSYVGCYYEDPFIRGFLRDYFLRPSCYKCKFTSLERVSDITIADWWGYKKTSETDKDYRYKGVSIILVNTDKGKKYVEKLQMVLKERTMEEAIRTNRCLTKPFDSPKNRAQFWDDYRNMDFDTLTEKYFSPEKVDTCTYLLQHHKNTDKFMRFIFVLSLPKRCVKKLLRILKIKR